jgi:D-glycero-D-manno-heptose 1,7-bisphosphate phosphatase
VGRPAVFLDRDGTLLEEVDYLTSAAQLVLLPGAAAAIARLNQAGVPAVVVTNQSAVARGLLDEVELARIHARFGELLAAQGARLDLVLYCPHHPDQGLPPYRRVCACRKPAAGMLAEAALGLGLDLGRSWIVGDDERDLAAGRAVGARGILVATGKGAQVQAALRARGGPLPPYARDVAEAVERILAEHAAGYGRIRLEARAAAQCGRRFQASRRTAVLGFEGVNEGTRRSRTR